MRLIRWKRIGQSGQELVAAVLFSFVIHGLLIAAVLLFSLIGSSKVSVPISYQVMLVSAPTAVEQTLPQEAQPPSTKPAEAPVQRKKSPKVPTSSARAKQQAAPKSAMPDLGASKAAQKKIERQPEAATEKEKPAAPSGPAAPAGMAEKKEAVAVSAGLQNQFPGLSGYFPLVKNKIEPNWNPPPGVKEARAKVQFRIFRSGRVGEVKLEESSGNFYFDQAAIRAILTSSPFPQLPDENPREYLEFSVDLTPKN
jgi:colicin import membrane protein